MRDGPPGQGVDESQDQFDGLPVLGDMTQVAEVVQQYEVDTVAVLPSPELDGPQLYPDQSCVFCTAVCDLEVRAFRCLPCAAVLCEPCATAAGGGEAQLGAAAMDLAVLAG